MADRDYDRNRRWRDDYGRDRYYYDRDYYDRYDNDRDYYNQNYYDRNYYERNYYDRNYYSRDYYYNRRYSPFGRGSYYDYDYDYDYDYPNYGYDYWGTPYSGWYNGPYSGVGPRNYNRSDERIQDDVNDRLTWHGYLDARDIEVKVNDGLVTLDGSVDSRRAKRMAENIADNVSGVKDVNNNLSIREGGRMGNMGTGGFEGGVQKEQLKQGMEVVGRNYNNVGQVKEVRSNDFLVDRPMARDVYVPFSAARIADGQIQLSVRDTEVDNQSWETPEIAGT